VLTFRWKYKKLKQIDVIVQRLEHFHRTGSQAFACAKMASGPKPVVEILRKRTVVINIEYG